MDRLLLVNLIWKIYGADLKQGEILFKIGGLDDWLIFLYEGSANIFKDGESKEIDKFKTIQADLENKNHSYNCLIKSNSKLINVYKKDLYETK